MHDPLLVSTERWRDLDLPVARRFYGARPHAEIAGVRAATEASAGADGLVALGGGSAIDTSQGGLERDRASDRLDPDHVLGRGVDPGLRNARPRGRHQARGRWRSHDRDRLRLGADPRAPATGDRGYGDERAGALRRGAVHDGPHRRGRPGGARRREADLRLAAGGDRRTGATPRRAGGCSKARCTPARRCVSGWVSATRWRRPSAAATAFRTGR